MAGVLTVCTFLASIVIVSSLSGTELAHRRIPRSFYLTRENDGIDIKIGTQEKSDTLLLDTRIVKEKRTGRVVYEDIAFNPLTYQNNASLIYDCPFSITAITVEHAGKDDTAGYPLILYGGIGAHDLLILFISQRNEGIDFTVKIWGQETEKPNGDRNLLEGIPSVTDELLFFSSAIQTRTLEESVTGNIVYQQPDYRIVTITSVQAWDISSGCKSGGYPSLLEGGVGSNNVTIQITSEKYSGYKYHVLVFGKIEKSLASE